MRADDERDPLDPEDPLDRWLGQQVTPLSPPPGTFALINRRARRRKVRKAVITVVSAAAVAAAVAVAVPTGLMLRLTPSPTVSGHEAARGKTPPITGEAGTTDGKGAHGATPSQSTTSPGPTSARTPTSASKPSATRSGPPVPANFVPSSVTFVSPELGWVIGQAGTPGSCQNANPNICTSIARTYNAGKTWVGAPAPSTTGPDGPTGVSGIRFLDGVNGWAFGPELWATHDGGQTWSKIDTGGQRVTDVETAGDRAYALWAQCAGAGSNGFAWNCSSYTLMTTLAGSDQWTPVSGVTSGMTRGSAAASANGGSGATSASAMIALTRTRGYLVAPDGTLYSGLLDGSAWRKTGTMPCPPSYPQASGLPTGVLIATISPTRLSAVCGRGSATTAPFKVRVYTSTDSGAQWKEPAAYVGKTFFPGWPTSLTATPDGTLIMSTDQGIYRLPPGNANWQPTNASGAKKTFGGFSYVGMTSSEQGVAVPADTALHEIWMTFDGGKTWSATPIG